MISTLVTLIVVLVIIGLILYVLNSALTLLPVDAKIRTVINIVAVLIMILFIADYFGLLTR